MPIYFHLKDNGSSNPFSSNKFLSDNIFSVFPSFIIFPFDINIVLSHVSSIISKSWEAITFIPFIEFRIFIKFLLFLGSRAAEGSSSSIISGSIERTAARETSFFLPSRELINHSVFQILYLYCFHSFFNASLCFFF